MSEPGSPSYEELLSRVLAAEVLVEELSGANVRLAGQLKVALEQIEVLRRQVGRDSSNSSMPPGSDGLGARAKAEAKKREQRERRKAEQEAKSATAAAGRGESGKRRPRGGQAGHDGAGLEWRVDPEEVVDVEPGACCGCGADLDPMDLAGPARVVGRVQVFDVPPVSLRCTEYRRLARRCGRCRVTTTAPMPATVPAGVAGGTTYGPGLRALAAYAGSSEVMGRERAADFLAATTGADVSTGFVSGCLHRLDRVLVAAGFEAALKRGLRAAAVLGTDETPARLGSAGRQRAPNAHVYTVRTVRTATRISGVPVPAQEAGDLIWCGAGPTRAGKVIDAFGILPGYGGVLIRDDYGGYLKYDKDLAGVQQCAAHLLRHLSDAAGMGGQLAWTSQADAALCEAMAAVNAARAAGMSAPDEQLAATLAGLRADFEAATALGRSVNINATWPKGSHPALVLARRLGAKVEQVWLFASRFDVPATNNSSEGAIRRVKVIQKISGIWHTLDTLAASMRIRSYLATTTSHGIDAITAIRRALDGDPWMPPALTA